MVDANVLVPPSVNGLRPIVLGWSVLAVPATAPVPPRGLVTPSEPVPPNVLPPSVLIPKVVVPTEPAPAALVLAPVLVLVPILNGEDAVAV